MSWFGKGLMSMSSIALILVLSLMYGLPCEGIGYQEPPNCARFQCPAYHVVHSQTEFEIRNYKEAGWIAFSVPDGRSYVDASTRGFLRLFAYIHGKNKDGANIEMTVPVLVDIPKSPTENASSYAVYFYLPQKYQEHPPLPTDNSSQPVELPPHKLVAVKRFGGYMDNNNVAQQALALKDSLIGTPWEAAISGTTYTVAGYNEPMDPLDRVNEVLFWFDR